MKNKRYAIRRSAVILLAALLFAGCTLRPAQSETADDPVKTTDPAVPVVNPGQETPQNGGDIFAWETEPQETEEEVIAPDGQPDPTRAEAGEYPTITAGHWWKFEDGTFVYD
ncbi:MAG: hypothetical protein J6V24_11280, partial [Clostridia bacterium]|nr:hypothetical protein [Clostridia bacterium]